MPLTPGTRGMISTPTFGLMKPGVRLVCTARGDPIDEAALLSELESGQVSEIVLDVFDNEVVSALCGELFHWRIV